MSKTVKELMIRDYQGKLDDVEDALVISIRGVPALDIAERRSTTTACAWNWQSWTSASPS